MLLKKSIKTVKKSMTNELIAIVRESPSTSRYKKKKKKGNVNYFDLIVKIPSNPPWNDCVLSTMKGCENLGNTCFFNSIMQSMTQTEPLVSYYLGLTGVEKSKRYEGPLSTCLAIFLSEMYANEPPTVRPDYLFSQIAKTNSKFKGYEQQDAQELLRCIQYEILLEYEKSEINIIYDSFKFVISSCILCKTCKNISKKSEDCFDISIPIPHASSDKPDDPVELTKAFEKLKVVENEIYSLAPEDILNPEKISECVDKYKSGKNPTLMECLWLFMRNELLSGENAYFCEKCNIKETVSVKKREFQDWIQVRFQENEDEDDDKFIQCELTETKRLITEEEDLDGSFDEKVYSSASKQFSFLELPPVLTFHLKRFKHKKNGFFKDGTRVEYPFEMDLVAFMNPRAKTQNTNYRLYAIVDHSGSMNSGHYIAYTRKLIINQDGTRERGDWYHISDSRASRVDQYEVAKADAYILFYERME
jgi:ubiquitin C-terminal hydrolase